MVGNRPKQRRCILFSSSVSSCSLPPLLELHCFCNCAPAELILSSEVKTLQKNKVHTCCNSINKCVFPLDAAATDHKASERLIGITLLTAKQPKELFNHLWSYCYNCNMTKLVFVFTVHQEAKQTLINVLDFSQCYYNPLQLLPSQQ